jgi:hypothetical protein
MTNLAAIGSSTTLGTGSLQRRISDGLEREAGDTPGVETARNALAAVIPTSLSNRAARALLPSFVQVQ